jgi:hypothetical protein
MALRGTLSDFGIADIFQLVGHQTKTGVLLLKNRDQEVRISFVDGNVVKAIKSSRDRADLLGNIMVRARVLTNEQLDDALSIQQRTMRRLGDILTEKRYVDLETLRQFTRLQTSETIYRLFVWESGTYEFTATDSIDHDPITQAPIRAEEILMEAFRMIDEWPSVRKVIPSNGMTLFVVKQIPAPKGVSADEGDDLLSGLDDAFDAMESGAGGDDDDDDDDEVGKTARIVFSIVTDGCSVQDVIDLSRVGEFEACKSLMRLIDQGYLRVEHPQDAFDEASRLSFRDVVQVVPLVVARVAAYAVLAVLVAGALRLVESGSVHPWSGERALLVRTSAWSETLARVHQSKLESALRVHRLRTGAAATALTDVVSAGILDESGLSGPDETLWVYDARNPGSPVARPFR